MAIDLLAEAKQKENELSSLYARHLADVGLYLLDAYTFTSNDQTLKNLESVTLNDARTYADKTISLLSTAERRYHIKGRLNKKYDKKDLDQAERWIEFCFTRSAENLALMSEYPYEEMMNWCSVLRGQVGFRVLLMHDKKLKRWYPEIRAFDPTQLAWSVGRTGNKLVSHFAEAEKDIILRDYNIDIDKKTSAKVRQIWTDEVRAYYVDDQQSLNKAHKLRRNPFLVLGCPTTPKIGGKTDAVKYQWESCYAGVRVPGEKGLYDLLHKHMSAWATQNMMGIMPPLAFASDDMRRMEKPVSGINKVTTHRTDEKFLEIPFRDFTQAHMAFIAQIQQRIQRATMSNIDYGELNQELSALAIKRLEKSKDQTFVPRIAVKRLAAKVIGYMLIEQYIDGGFETTFENESMGFPESEMPVDVKFFKDHSFEIECDYFALSPEESIADATIANNLKALGVPAEWIMENTLKMANFAAVLRTGMKNKAIDISPVLTQYFAIKAFIETGEEHDDVAANILLASMNQELMKLTQGGMQLEIAGEQLRQAGTTGQPQLPEQGQPGGKPPGLLTMPNPGIPTGAASLLQNAPVQTQNNDVQQNKLNAMQTGMQNAINQSGGQG
jgi:hypothetical protein